MRKQTLKVNKGQTIMDKFSADTKKKLEKQWEVAKKEAGGGGRGVPKQKNAAGLYDQILALGAKRGAVKHHHHHDKGKAKKGASVKCHWG